MIDLSIQKHKRYKIKWFDGCILEINTPSQGDLLKMATLLKNIEDEEKALEEIMLFLHKALNTNTIGKVINLEEIEQLFTLNTIVQVVEDYFKFTTTELGKSLSPISQAPKQKKHKKHNNGNR